MTKKEALKQGKAARRLLKYPKGWSYEAVNSIAVRWAWELKNAPLRIVGDLGPDAWFVCYVDGAGLNSDSHKTPDAAIAEVQQAMQRKVWQAQRVLDDIQNIQAGLK